MEEARRSRAGEPKELRGNKALAKELLDGVVDLVGAGFEEHEVLRVWSYAKYRIMVKAVRRSLINRRIDFAHDVAYGISGILGGGKSKKSPLEEHVKSLESIIREHHDG